LVRAISCSKPLLRYRKFVTDNRKYQIFVRDMVGLLVNVVTQKGAKIASYKRQFVKHPVSRDFCTTLYTVVGILKEIL
jgi:hypothetical protein